MLFGSFGLNDGLNFLDGSLLYERVPNKPEVDRLTITPPQAAPMQAQQTILKRTRPPFDEINGSDGEFVVDYVLFFIVH